jgi:hypothetical protein
MKKFSLIIKTSLCFILLIVVFASCSKETDTILNLTNSQWYLTRTNNGGGLVNLKIEGSTNSDKVTIRTFGDGVVSDRTVGLDSKKNFKEDVVISFTATSVPSGEFEVSTKVMAYKGSDTLVVPLNSGKLKY